MDIYVLRFKGVTEQGVFSSLGKAMKYAGAINIRMAQKTNWERKNENVWLYSDLTSDAVIIRQKLNTFMPDDFVG